MNKEVIWGVPTQRAKKEEKFNTPVVTMSSLAKKGAGRKFSFNAAAQDVLGLEGGETYVSFGFNTENGDIYLMSSETETPNGFLLTKQCTFSNKRVFEYIAKNKELDTNEENYLHLTAVEGEPFYKVASIQTESMEVTIKEDDPQVDASTMETGEAVEVDNQSIGDEPVNEVEVDDNWG